MKKIVCFHFMCCFWLKWAFLCSRFWILGLKTPQGVTKAQLTSVSNSKLSWFSTLSSLIRYNSFSISTSVLYGVSRTLVRPAYNNFPQATQAKLRRILFLPSNSRLFNHFWSIKMTGESPFYDGQLYQKRWNNLHLEAL